ncbi:MAG: exodeoxyribonuclease VII large subunit [Thermoflexales bacterium]
MPSSPLSVSELTQLIKGRIESEPLFESVSVAGEISNCRRSAAGHLYFTLRDAESQVRCVMWRTQVSRLRVAPQDGMSVVVYGRVGVYEREGTYQLFASAIEPAGFGPILAQLERLKQRLAAEGLFDVARKRPLPRFPGVIGVVTSPEAAAWQDVLHVLGRRNPSLRVILSPTLVQGDDAPLQIVAAIRRLNDLQGRDRPDVILVVRGGGSLEELSAFNDEAVVRAVAASAIPVVSGVGHEVDVTLTDLAADVRAPTPSVAAELVTAIPRESLLERLDEQASNLQEVIRTRLIALREQLDAQHGALVAQMGARLAASRNQLDMLQQALRLLRPQQHLARQRVALQELRRRLDLAERGLLRAWRESAQRLAAQLQALSPLNTLARGYAIVQRDNHEVVQHVAQVVAGERLRVLVSDGLFHVRVES